MSTYRLRPDWLAFGWTTKDPQQFWCAASTEVREISMETETVDVSHAGGSAAHSLISYVELQAVLDTYEIAADDHSRAAAAKAVNLPQFLGSLEDSITPKEALEVLYEMAAQHASTPREEQALEEIAKFLGH